MWNASKMVRTYVIVDRRKSLTYLNCWEIANCIQTATSIALSVSSNKLVSIFNQCCVPFQNGLCRKGSFTASSRSTEDDLKIEFLWQRKTRPGPAVDPAGSRPVPGGGLWPSAKQQYFNQKVSYFNEKCQKQQCFVENFDTVRTVWQIWTKLARKKTF